MKILDLFCGAGGASVGISRAISSADITGIDIAPQKNYPFKFIRGDALEFDMAGYDVVFASPPCQEYSRLKKLANKKYGDYIPIIRDLLIKNGKPFVIENVPGAPLKNYIMLCGTMFGLNIIRHRLFECSPALYFPPYSCNHTKKANNNSRKFDSSRYAHVCGNYHKHNFCKEAMGINWMNKKELAQAVPPDYTEYIFKELIKII